MSKAGRPIERKGEYERITLDVRKDLLKMVDASPKSRREYIEDLLVTEKGTTMTYPEILEQYINSSDFKEGVISATKASWGGGGYSVELFEDGTWRNLWNNQIGNLYESTGIIMNLPTLETDDMNEYVNGGGGTEDDFLSEGFELELDECSQALRDALHDKAVMYGEKYA